MKIYNKKGLIWGVVWFILGSGLLVIKTLEPESILPEQIKDVVIALLLIMIGIGSVIRACSKRATREDKLEKLDERNQLVELKTKSKSFQLTNIICFCLMLALFAMGKVSGEALFINIGIGLAFAFSISLYTELFTYLYYDKRN